MNKKSVIKKTIGVGSSTLASRMLGVVREVLQAQYLGVNALSDAFNMAFNIPNSLRKIFAEGAVSAALVPTFVQSIRKNQRDMVDSLVFLAFLFFEGLVLLICALFMWLAPWIIRILAPGFSPEQIEYTVPMLRILMPFIFFISSSAIFGSALQSVNHFFIPAITPACMNFVIIASLVICIAHDLPISYFCYFWLLAGLVQFIVHVAAFVKLNFSFAKITQQTWQLFKPIGINFLFCLVSVGMTSEISLLVDTMFASYLPAGSISLMKYAIRFMGIPLGIFASSLSTIMLPYLSRVSAYAPKRLSFYLLEASKLVFWVSLPMMLIMGFLAEKIFHTIFLSSKFSITQVHEAQCILIAFLIGLCSLALNKILLNMYYSRNVMWLPAVIALAGITINILCNFLFVRSLHATGIALATSIAAIAQTILLIIFLRYNFGFMFYADHFFKFVVRYFIQLTIILPSSMIAYYSITYLIQTYLSQGFAKFFLFNIGFWLWAGPLCGFVAIALYLTRKYFGVHLYFLD